MTGGKVRQYPYFVRLFHTSTPLGSVELSKEWQRVHDCGKVRQYPYFVGLFHTSTPLRSVELSKEWQRVHDWGKVRQYPYFVRLFHTSTPLRSVELSKKWRNSGFHGQGWTCPKWPIEQRAHYELHCGIPVEQNNPGYLKEFLVNYWSFSRLITKHDNVILQFTTARLITIDDKVSLQFTIAWLLQFTTTVFTIYDRYYNSRQNTRVKRSVWSNFSAAESKIRPIPCDSSLI